MEKEDVTIEFAHICDHAFISKGKANMMGVFKEIYPVLS